MTLIDTSDCQDPTLAGLVLLLMSLMLLGMFIVGVLHSRTQKEN